MAHTDAAQVERLAADDVDEWNIAAIEPAALAPLFDDGTRAVVALLGDDDDNLRCAAVRPPSPPIIDSVSATADQPRLLEDRTAPVKRPRPDHILITCREGSAAIGGCRPG